MFKAFKRFLKKSAHHRDERNNQDETSGTAAANAVSLLSESLEYNISRIKNDMGNSSDLSVRIFETKGFRYAICFIKELVDKSILNSLSLQISDMNAGGSDGTENGLLDKFMNNLLAGKDAAEGSDYEMLYGCLLNGNIIILIEGCGCFIALNTYEPQGREISEPTSQTIIRGSKEAFTEKISVNISLIRKRIKTKDLRAEELNIGNVTKTNIVLMYIEKTAKREIVDEIRRRLMQVKIDGVLESGYIEELIKDDPYSVFPLFLNSEKPDAVAGALLEGRVAIFVDGTPYVLTAPCLFFEFFHTSEDYYHNFAISSMVRMIRYISFFLTLLVPSLYVALTTYHQEMIPTPLLISIAAQREGVPFPAFVEAAIMLITFEILQESGIRMPRAVGSAISIAGALVIGQAAVEAGIISAVMVIVVSLTAISNFVISNYSMSNSIRTIRCCYTVLAAVYGLYGIFMGLIILVLHLSKLKSVGVPYLTPVAPRIKGQNKDIVIRAPLWKLRYRPAFSGDADSPRINMEGPVESAKKDNQELG